MDPTAQSARHWQLPADTDFHSQAVTARLQTQKHPDIMPSLRVDRPPGLPCSHPQRHADLILVGALSDRAKMPAMTMRLFHMHGSLPN